MRSLLLSRLWKLCLRKQPALGHLGGARYLSGTPIYQIVGARGCGSTSRDGDIGRLVVTDLSEFCYGGSEVLEKKVPMELMTETGTIGASHGWVATLKDGVVRLQDDLNPSASDSDPKRISLPPLVTLPHCQTQLVTNVAMSSSSPEDDEDCIVAVKFLGPQLSLCRPALKDKAEWVNIRIEDPGFFSSRVMYSKRDGMFSMPASGGSHIGSWDLEKHRHEPKIETLFFPNHPEFVQSEWEKLDKCFNSEELVESRATGEVFMVKRYKERKHYNKGMMRMKERLIMVFKLKYGLAKYTEDIGDLCICLSMSEPFCLKASMYNAGQNSVYFIDKSEIGIFDLDDREKQVVFSFNPVPYFIPPPQL